MSLRIMVLLKHASIGNIRQLSIEFCFLLLRVFSIDAKRGSLLYVLKRNVIIFGCKNEFGANVFFVPTTAVARNEWWN